MLIINALQNFQAITQAILERHNFCMVALKHDTVTMLFLAESTNNSAIPLKIALFYRSFPVISSYLYTLSDVKAVLLYIIHSL